MRLRIVALGQRMPAWINAGFDEYARRLPREYALELIEVKPEPRDRGKSVAQMLLAEAARIRAACADDRIVALDERGKPWTTRDVATKLEQWRGDNTNVAFVIGSADGLDRAFRRSAAFSWDRCAQQTLGVLHTAAGTTDGDVTVDSAQTLARL